MRLGRYVFIILFMCFFLQGCTSTRIAEELQLGRVTFESGDFRAAFHQLLPLAVKGNPEAQYAVGYMYYYGYGVAQDTECGLFWINLSASQHYLPAIQALNLVNHKDDLYRPKAKKSVKHQYSKHQLVESLPNTAEVKPELAKQEKDNDDVILSLNSPENITPKEKYTLQVFGSHDLDTVKELQARLNLKDSTAFGRTQYKGRDWYVLTYGRYPAIYQAKLAQDELPKGLKSLKPWVRKTEDLVWVT